MIKNSYKVLFHLLLFLIFLLIYQINENEEIYSWKIKQQINKIEIFYKLCNNGILLNKKTFVKSENPKISIITPIYNGSNFILRLLRSIQNQFFNEIEIIFIDDFSLDDTIKVVQKLQKEDERIILIKNKVNKGTLITRNLGVLKSKGEYLTFPDVDDIFTKNILKICYKLSKRYNYEMIRFNVYEGERGNCLLKNVKLLKNQTVYQPELSTYIFYGLGYLKLSDFNVANKFIKRDAFIRTLNNIEKFYLTQKMIIYEDGLINFALHRNINSFFLIKKIGYYYIFNKKKISFHKNRRINKLRNFFLYLKFVFENSKNNKYEKNMAFFLINRYKKNFKFINLVNKDFKFYKNVNDMLINCEFIFKNYTFELKKFNSIIKQKQLIKEI